ncbi:MAG: hypothetical protein ABFD61_03105 [Chloroherpetonaceae bacterium]
MKYSTDSNSPIQFNKYINSEEEKNRLSNKALVLLRSNNLAMANSNKAYKDKVIEFNNFLKDKDIHQIARVLQSLILQK